MLRFQITERGKAIVASLEFAEMLRNFIGELKGDGMSEEQGGVVAVSLVAWTLSGHDYNQPPSGADDLVALASFVNSHSTEVQAAVDACLELLVKSDCGPIVH